VAAAGGHGHASSSAAPASALPGAAGCEEVACRSKGDMFRAMRRITPGAAHDAAATAKGAQQQQHGAQRAFPRSPCCPCVMRLSVLLHALVQSRRTRSRMSARPSARTWAGAAGRWCAGSGIACAPASAADTHRSRGRCLALADSLDARPPDAHAGGALPDGAVNVRAGARAQLLPRARGALPVHALPRGLPRLRRGAAAQVRTLQRRASLRACKSRAPLRAACLCLTRAVHGRVYIAGLSRARRWRCGCASSTTS
jgi:hypothetical protein